LRGSIGPSIEYHDAFVSYRWGEEEILEWRRRLTLQIVVVGDFRSDGGPSIEYHDAFVLYQGVGVRKEHQTLRKRLTLDDVV